MIERIATKVMKVVHLAKQNANFLQLFHFFFPFLVGLWDKNTNFAVDFQPPYNIIRRKNMKIALIGYGKMGKMIEQIAISRGHEIVSIIDIDNQQDFDSPEFASADVAIEFTAPHVAYGNYLKAFSHGVKVVSGSTGWMKDHGDDVRRMCCEEGQTLFWASNFSIGVAIFSAVNRYLAKIMNQFPQYDVEMEETHHVHKLDHPSGTAITLAEEIVEKIDRKTEWVKGFQHNADGTG